MKVVKVLAGWAVLTVVSAAAAQAIEVRQVVEIKASPAAVWAKVGEWCAIKTWHPNITNCDARKKRLSDTDVERRR